jgi:hypothetical protein
MRFSRYQGAWHLGDEYQIHLGLLPNSRGLWRCQMSMPENGKVRLLQKARTDLAKRLRGRSSEIERVILAQVHAVSDPAACGDAEYLAGLGATVTAVIDYALANIEHGEEWSDPIPSIAIAQAHRAARNGVGLATVLLRYTTGQRYLEHFIMAEADYFPHQTLRHISDMQWSLLERVIAVISSEYNREFERAATSLEQRRGKRVQRLLAGESVDLSEFAYKFDDAWHLGVIGIGIGAHDAIRALAAALDCQLLSVSRGDQTMWAWLGRECRLSVADIDVHLGGIEAPDDLVAVGEPCDGIDGWRLTHHQAQAALQVALHRRPGIAHYGEDMLLAAVLQNETLGRSLEQMYLRPLAGQKDGGAAWRTTLRAYFKAQGNAATAANAVGVHRHTIERHKREIEKKLGRLLHTCQPEMETALRLHELRTITASSQVWPLR